jgi:hypothetical protein
MREGAPPTDVPQLSPRDQYRYFRKPVVTYLSMTTAVVPVCGDNPDRIALIFPALSNGAVHLAPDSGVNAGQGFPLGTTGAPLEIYQALAGNLSQVAWYGLAVGVGTTLTVIEVILEHWPAEALSHDPVTEAGRAVAAG